jgi:hypothetical protein
MAYEALADGVRGMGLLIGSGGSMQCFVGVYLPPKLTR